MSINMSKITFGALLVLALIMQLTSPALANGYTFYGNPYYNNSYYSRPYYYSNPYYYQPSVFNTHPILSGALVGGAIGGAGGAVVGALQPEHTDGTIGTDAAIGAGAGALLGTGVGIMRNAQLHPYGY